MNRIKQSTANILGILLFALSAAVATVPAQEPTQVQVVNTPTVILPRGSTVGIDSSNNTVKIDPTVPVTVRGEKTEVVFDQIVAAGCCPPNITPKVDVSAYKQIRIVVKIANQSNGSASITPFLRLDNTPDYYGERIALDDYFQNSMNKVYDMPGQIVQVLLQGNGNWRVIIYGRRN